MNNDSSSAIKKLKLSQQNNVEGPINLSGADEKDIFKCKRIIIKTLAKLYESANCHSRLQCIFMFTGKFTRCYCWPKYCFAFGVI